MRDDLAGLRRKLALLERTSSPRAALLFPLGCPEVDRALGGGLGRGGLHEVYAARPADAPAACGFALALALQAAAERPFVWVRHDYAGAETGGVYAPGLAEFGLDAARLILVRVKTPTDVLRAGAEAAACSSLGAVMMEVWNDAPALDLTASRRLSFAGAASGVTLMMIREGASPSASAAASRWSVSGAASAPLEGNAPGRPAFGITLLRHRNGLPQSSWIVEWDRDRREFDDAAPLARGVASLSAGGRLAAAGEGARGGWRKAG